MKLSFSTFYNTNCFWEFRRPSPLSSRAKSQGRFEGMCMSCRPVDIHPVEGNKLKAKLCCLVSLMLLLLSAFFFSFSATQVQCIIVCQVFSFRILLVFPPSNCRLSSEWRSQVNLHQRQCDHVTVIICYLTFDFPFLSLDLILFAMLYFSARLFVQTWSSLGLWFLIFGLCLCDDVSDLSIYRDHDSEKSLQRGWEPWTSIHSGKIQPRSLDRKFLINLRWNIKFALSLTVY